MSDPRFRSAQREALWNEYMPEWTSQAECRGDRRVDLFGRRGRFTPGVTWDRAFKDEVSQQPDGDYQWSADLLEVMEVCAGCPVRRQCLAYSFEVARDGRHFGIFGGAPGRIREKLGSVICEACGGKGFTDGSESGIRFKDFRWLYSVTDKDGKTTLLSPGFPCLGCHESGRVKRSDWFERLDGWFVTFARRRGWIIEDTQEATA